MKRRHLIATMLVWAVLAVLAGTALAAGPNTNGNAGSNRHGNNPNGNPHGSAGTSSGAGTAGQPSGTGPSVQLPPAAPPIAGRSAKVAVASGTVLVKLPGHSGFVPLDQAASIPLGTVIDATNGVVMLTSVKDQGVTQTGQFGGSAFRIDQTRSSHPTTVLALVGKLSCPVGGAKARLAVQAARHRRTTRSLWGHDNHGRFVTRGWAASASVRGTVWLTRDTCAGTFFRVAHGAIVVHDRGRRANVVVTAGRSYLAHLRKRR